MLSHTFTVLDYHLVVDRTQPSEARRIPELIAPIATLFLLLSPLPPETLRQERHPTHVRVRRERYRWQAQLHLPADPGFSAGLMARQHAPALGSARYPARLAQAARRLGRVRPARLSQPRPYQSRCPTHTPAPPSTPVSRSLVLAAIDAGLPLNLRSGVSLARYCRTPVLIFCPKMKTSTSDVQFPQGTIENS